MKGWKELPYRGEPPYKAPKPKPPKRIRTRKEKWRDNIISAFIIIISLAFISFVVYFDPNHSSDQNWKNLLVFLASLLLMIGLSISVNALNIYLRGDDLDNSKDSGEEKSDEGNDGKKE